MIRYFKFEEDFVEDNVRCIPMIARFKLDACGIKLKLKEWSKMGDAERLKVSEYPCDSSEQLAAYRAYLKALIQQITGNPAQEQEVDKKPGWADTKQLPTMLLQKLSELGLRMEPAQWQALDDLQRFALLKLSRPSHENRNLRIAMHEFGLI